MLPAFTVTLVTNEFMNTMKAVVLRDVKTYSIETVKVPQIGANEVLIKAKNCGICGTDVSMYLGKYLPVKPVIPGHEVSGEVVDVGQQVRAIKVGDRVTVDENVSCGTCYFCKHQQKLFCPDLYQIGIHSDGGFAQYFKAPEANVFRLPDNMSYEYAPFTETLACVTRAVDRAGIVTGDRVVVIGDGPIGLSCMQVAKIDGASQVIGVGLTDYRLKKALEIGADVVIDSSKDDPIRTVRDATNDIGPDVVIEAVGSSATYLQALEMVRRGGKVAVMGVPPATSKMEIEPFSQIFNKELTLHASFAGTYDTWIRAISLISSGRFEVGPLISHRMSLYEVPEGVRMMMERTNGAIKILVSPE
jgi:L-iditol 2-dehydrogenase